MSSKQWVMHSASHFLLPPPALAAALDIQRELTPAQTHGLPLRVRAALHTGTAQERAGDYFGPNVNRVARLMIGTGGQTLLSLATETLVREALPPGRGCATSDYITSKICSGPSRFSSSCTPIFLPIFLQ